MILATIVPKQNHTEVSVANLVINLATTKYFFCIIKYRESCFYLILFLTNSFNLFAKESSTETNGKRTVLSAIPRA